ncbi:SCD [Cordylochernes scorpioides]|uniref:SCD n=1 Tax=Cordylochernes scorpioides TaxID=51811 RepID=A0ABY6LLV3_9ARAC|nr:SCD [Cordylochernes scorpioides]
MPSTESVSISPLEEESDKSRKEVFKAQIVWRNVILFIILHGLAFYGFYLAMKCSVVPSFWLGYAYSHLGGWGITAGYHRLWCHRGYKAKLPLRIFLMLFSCIAGQDDIYVWVRDHRVHHKFTDADPYNINRGFFFAHMGWLLYKKHPDVIAKGKSIDMRDVLADPVVRFQRKYYKLLFLFFIFVLTTWICMYILGYGFVISLCYFSLFSYMAILHSAWTVNSLAHYYGYKPYDAKQKATENVLVSFLAAGEGFHNYHHAFPYDYSTSELGYYFNITTLFIDGMALIGQAYDLKRANVSFVQYKKLTRGDGENRWYVQEKNSLKQP